MQVWNCFFKFFHLWHIARFFKPLVFNLFICSALLVIVQSRIVFKLPFPIWHSVSIWFSLSCFHFVNWIACSELRFSLLIFEEKSSPWHDDSFGRFVTLFNCAGAISITPFLAVFGVLSGITKRLSLAFIMGHVTACGYPFFMPLRGNTCVMTFVEGISRSYWVTGLPL